MKFLLSVLAIVACASSIATAQRNSQVCGIAAISNAKTASPITAFLTKVRSEGMFVAVVELAINSNPFVVHHSSADLIVQRRVNANQLNSWTTEKLATIGRRALPDFCGQVIVLDESSFASTTRQSPSVVVPQQEASLSTGSIYQDFYASKPSIDMKFKAASSIYEDFYFNAAQKLNGVGSIYEDFYTQQQQNAAANAGSFYQDFYAQESGMWNAPEGHVMTPPSYANVQQPHQPQQPQQNHESGHHSSSHPSHQNMDMPHRGSRDHQQRPTNRNAYDEAVLPRTDSANVSSYTGFAVGIVMMVTIALCFILVAVVVAACRARRRISGELADTLVDNGGKRTPVSQWLDYYVVKGTNRKRSTSQEFGSKANFHAF